MMSSCRTMPRLHTSVAEVYGFLAQSSGDKYSGVPTNVVMRSVFPAILLTPKSPSLTPPPRVRHMLRGLTSLCTTPLLWQ